MLKFDIIDVFSSVLGDGNPVAIVHDADRLDEREMLKIASWLGLPETAFVMAPSQQGDYTLRIFSPLCELAFAGHPSIGALAAQLARKPAWAERSKFSQECKAGIVELDRFESNGETVISVQTPLGAEVRSLSTEDTFGLLSAMSIRRRVNTCELVSTGAKWIVMGFDDAATVLDADPDQQSILELSVEHDVSGITIFAPNLADDADYIVRSFAPRIGVVEDAACGGGNACVAAAISHASGQGVQYTATQGQKLGRNAKIFASGPFLDKRFRIGGHTRVFASGDMRLS